ncbi:hypothetical protein B296_00054027 [Ensete ventricosum]|uniref:Plant heme peroxidase family profile domain-containing protein n=1 Tax=Ensete ventricosum TaxID=4639 RepID=A0A426XM24_ENSVE|nr:hypothetical protein B296_00054027 [Ensete ventricosum]
MASSSTVFAPAALVLLLLLGSTSAQLSTSFYSSSCPKLFSTVKPVVQSAISKEKRLGASVLRLFFHDCFVLGCDGSVLLDDTPTFTGEKTAKPNNNSIRGFQVIDQIKTAVEKACPGVVSCADILAIAARDSVVIVGSVLLFNLYMLLIFQWTQVELVLQLGGPHWDVKLGRRDSRRASLSKANKQIPPPTSSLSNLISKFSAKGLSAKDMVALSGKDPSYGNAENTYFRCIIQSTCQIKRTR